MSAGFIMTASLNFLVAAAVAALCFPLVMRVGWAECQRWLANDPDHSNLPAQPGDQRTWLVGSLVLAGLLALTLTSSHISGALWADALAAVIAGVTAALLVALARIDLLTRLLPDRLTLAVLGLGLSTQALADLTHELTAPALLSIGLADSLIGAAAGFVLPAGFSWAYSTWRGKTMMGRGDLFFIAGLGAWLGWQALPILLFLASTLTLLALAVFWLLKRGQGHVWSIPASLPLGPGLSAGAVLVWLSTGVPL